MDFHRFLDEETGTWMEDEMSVTAVDDYTVECVLPVPFAPFLRSMTTAIYPRHILESYVDEGTFNEVPFQDRYRAAASAGFLGIECPFPYELPPQDLAQIVADNGVQQVLCNLPPDGMAAIPGQEEAFAAGLQRALTYARALGCLRLHAMAGAPPAETDRADCEAVYVRNLKWAAEALQPHGVRLLIEPINTTGMPGYFLHTAAQARRLMDKVGHDNLFLQLDLYHCQIMTGNLSETIKTHLEVIDHFQIAGHPGRHEPDVGEINYPFLFDLIDELGYTGWVGCEYRPRLDTAAGLGWFRPYVDESK